MTPNQVNAVMEATAARAGWDDKDPAEVRELLTNEGHPAFAQSLELAAPSTLQPQLPARGDADAFVPEGSELLGADDLVVPQLKLKQPQTQGADDVPDGHWFQSADTGAAAAVAEFAVLKIIPTRQWKSPHPSSERDKKQKALAQAQAFGLVVDGDHKGSYCRSEDRVLPVASSAGTVSTTCKGCPVNATEFLCRKGFTVEAIDLTDRDGDGPAVVPVRYYVDGKSVKLWKNLQTFLKLAGVRQHKHMRDFVVSASSEKDGAFYVPVFSFAPNDDASCRQMLDMVAGS